MSKPCRMPKQKPGTSEQVVGTPWEFIYAVAREFGEPDWDLAALSTNKKAERYLGPDHRSAGHQDALAFPWAKLYSHGRPLWLNPPFAAIGKWAKKCVIEAQAGTHILMLVPASIGANWWDLYVTPHADVYSVGRMIFEGSKDMYPKDLALCHFWKLGGHKTKRWRWEK